MINSPFVSFFLFLAVSLYPAYVCLSFSPSLSSVLSFIVSKVIRDLCSHSTLTYRFSCSPGFKLFPGTTWYDVNDTPHNNWGSSMDQMVSRSGSLPLGYHVSHFGLVVIMSSFKSFFQQVSVFIELSNYPHLSVCLCIHINYISIYL